jgi:hypothetical protein
MNLFKIKNLVWAGSVFFIFGCSNTVQNTANTPAALKETPKALQETDSEIKSSFKRYDNNLVEELYNELADKNPELKKLEEDLTALKPKPFEMLEKFNEYNSKSVAYYNSAGQLSNQIGDSVLRSKINELIKASQTKYDDKTAGVNSLLNTIQRNTISLNDYHAVLQIIITMPLIEKFQTDNLPGKINFQDLIKEQDKLLQKEKSLTPKY